MPEPGPHPAPDGHPVPRREQVIGQGIAWLAQWTLRWLLIAAGAVLLGFVVQQLWSILLPVVLALLVTSVLQPAAQVLEGRLHFPKLLSAATVLVVTLAAIVGLGFALAPSVASQSKDIATSASDGLNQVQTWLQNSKLGISQDQIRSAISAAQQRLRSSATSIAAGVLTGVSAVGSFVVNLVLTLVLTFFFLKDGHRFLPWLGRLAGPRAGGHLVAVGGRAWGTLGGFIRTQALVGVIDGVLIGLGLVVVGVPLAGPLAILTFFGAFVPIVGAVTVGLIAVLVTLVTNGFGAALVMTAIILAVQQLEGNVLLPFLQARSMNLHAAVVLLAITLGSTLFGVIGAFLAVPVAAVGAVVLRYLDETVDHRVEESRPRSSGTVRSVRQAATGSRTTSPAGAAGASGDVPG